MEQIYNVEASLGPCEEGRFSLGKWVHTYIIKVKILWEMDVPQDASWTIRKVLGLRDIGQPLIQYRIGNGQSTYLWFYNWHSLGPLYKRFGEEVVYHAGRSLQAKVSSIIHLGQWRWPRARNRVIQNIVAQTDAALFSCPEQLPCSTVA